MKYGVVVCSNCRHAKSVELRHASTKCHVCGKTIQMKHAKLLFSSDSQQEVSEALGMINAELEGRLDEFKSFFSDSKNDG